jgi:hypothetical protein
MGPGFESQRDHKRTFKLNQSPAIQRECRGFFFSTQQNNSLFVGFWFTKTSPVFAFCHQKSKHMKVSLYFYPNEQKKRNVTKLFPFM